MCGIIAATAQRHVYKILLEGLSRLEYRGYDSAGICTLQDNGRFSCLKAAGKVQRLREKVKEEGCPGCLGIAHTRWATHGVPSVENAHPHICGTLAMVHNGIIENFAALRQHLQDKGYTFKSQTDSEVLLCLIHSYLKSAGSVEKALRQALKEVEGSYALALIDSSAPGVLYAARKDSPLIIGLGIGENFAASDVLALLPVTHRFIYLNEREIAVITTEDVTICDLDGNRREAECSSSDLDAESISKGPYRHFMQKEIFEQPQALQNTLMGRIDGSNVSTQAIIGAGEDTFSALDNITIVACGTSYHAGLVGRYWFEDIAGVSTSVEIASEYRYRKAVVRPETLFVVISQSGETADTLASLRLARTQGYAHILCICNVNGSSIVRESDFTMLTRAGAEIGVASTKAFTTQLLCLLLLAVLIGRQKGTLSKERATAILDTIKTLPALCSETLKCDREIAALAEKFAGKHHCLFLGRGIMYPIALEGALKLKEISYIHAEGYAAGELKHGPIALIDENMPVVVVAPNNALLNKLESNIEEVRARGGKLYVLSQEHSSSLKNDSQITLINVPAASEILQALIYTLPLQLLAYHCAVINGTDVDQPRNLAKSVTVE